MSGIDPDLCHKLSIYKEARPIFQKKRRLVKEKRLAAEAEV